MENMYNSAVAVIFQHINDVKFYTHPSNSSKIGDKSFFSTCILVTRS